MNCISPARVEIVACQGSQFIAMAVGGSSSPMSTNRRREEIAQFQTKLTNLLAFPNDGTSSIICCHCPWDPEAKIVTNWEGDNKGRSERVCRDYPGCGFHQWKDPVICERGRTVVNHLYNGLERSVRDTVDLEMYVSSLEDEVARLQALLGMVAQ